MDEADVRTRLQRAALALFREHGYEHTTAAGIAARAGVTERTFFRYFPDKREVLFDGEARLRDLLTAAIADAPPDLLPLETLFGAFKTFQPMLEGNWSFSKPRQEVIAATPALQERELAKAAAIGTALAAALRDRGVPAPRARLAAQTGMAAFVDAISGWLDDPTIALGKRLDDALGELRQLISAGT